MTIHLNYIPVETANLFSEFARLIFMQKYTLVGGTALALHLGHRQSEDLDFIYDGQPPSSGVKFQKDFHLPGL